MINKKDIYCIFAILFVSTIFFISSYSRFGMFFIDTSREVYIPMVMNNGDVLYKDIFNVYAPLGYQLNALLTKLFGEHLRTFYFAGFINSLIFSIGLYILLRFFQKDRYLLNTTIVLFIIVSCIYAVSLVNYIFPYSYSIIYSLTAILYAIIFFLYYIKKRKKICIIISFLLFGISFWLKYEFVFWGLLLIYVLFDSETSLKTKIYCIIAFLSLPCLSTIILFFQGCSFQDVKSAVNYIFLLSKSQEVAECYEFLGLIPSTESMKDIFEYFIKTFSFSMLFLFFVFKVLFIENKIFRYITIIIFSFICILVLLPTFYISNSFYFNWIGIFVLILLFIFSIIFYLRFKKNQVNENDKFFFILLLSSILTSMKCIFSINFNNYGSYYFPLLFVVVILFFVSYIPDLMMINNKIKKNIYYSSCIFLCLLFILYSFSNIERRRYAFSIPIETEKGIIFVDEQKGLAINNLISYIKDNTNKDDTILVLPEGAAINFLTDRKSNNKYYYLIPPNIEIFGEDNIVKDLENNLPDYLVIQPMSYLNFNETYFCESFGNKICSIIPKYYEKPIVFGKEFWLAIYKKKESAPN